MSNASDFVIENGVLKKYVGPGGDVVIPNEVVSIGNAAFDGCKKLTSITLPDSVTSIGECAFYDCSSLTSITFQGSIAQWEEIILQDDWNNEVLAKVVHCTDGDVEI